MIRIIFKILSNIRFNIFQSYYIYKLLAQSNIKIYKTSKLYINNENVKIS